MAAKNVRGRKQVALRKKKLAEKLVAKKKLDDDERKHREEESAAQQTQQAQLSGRDMQLTQFCRHTEHRERNARFEHNARVEQVLTPSRMLDLDGDVCTTRAKSYAAGGKTLEEIASGLGAEKLQQITGVRLPTGAFGDSDAPEIHEFAKQLPSLEYIDLSYQHLCGEDSKVLLFYLLVERGVQVVLYQSPSFARLAWSIINDLPVAAIQRLRWLTWDKVKCLDGEWLGKFYGEEKAAALRLAHANELRDANKVSNNVE